MNYKPVIGLEVHVELKTKSKMFCSCKADYFGEKPNTNTCPVCLGLPGALPVPNKKAIEGCVMIGLALNCKINNFSKFDRKNYFYPDLPKGYQISQYDQPFCTNGYVYLGGETNRHLPSGTKKRIRIRRVHMEEDTAKLIHQGQDSLIDFNRSGVPLVEIVTEPDFESAKEVVEYLKKLQQIVRYLNVSDADMEKGNMRLEPNISLMINDKGLRIKKTLPKYKVEVKNINSFRFAEKAIEYEIKRQTEILSEGKTPVQETRGWDEDKQKTVTQRIKEEAQDYRYFPEPDIPPIRFSDSDIASIECIMPELPDVKMQRFTNIYRLSAYDAEILTRDRKIAEYFDETTVIGFHHEIKRKRIANYIINRKIDINKILPAELIQIIIKDNQKSSLDEDKLSKVIAQILIENQKAVTDYKNGKVQAIGFLIGKVKQHFPKADTRQIKNVLEKSLK
ncbi:MAG: Asp-tRNA(Asn)/Glu-tRNA(Gln) amidotransferase subunit GatB [Candidatus Levybacteria bacterium]|nr:Asp-tRNA(Asn)/Glu-tRNA(Gln) amidotransferase subunit GatB [Candidatus Levybacteria bacterium]